MTDSMKQAQRAMELFNAAMLDFQAACMRHDWTAAEKSRGDIAAAIDGYLDRLAAMYKRAESG